VDKKWRRKGETGVDVCELVFMGGEKGGLEEMERGKISQQREDMSQRGHER